MELLVLLALIVGVGYYIAKVSANDAVSARAAIRCRPPGGLGFAATHPSSATTAKGRAQLL